VRGLRIGVPRDLLMNGVDADVRSRVEAALATLARAGAELDTVELPNSKYAIPVYYLVATAEASSNLARFDGVRYGHRASAAELGKMYTHTRKDGFGPEVKRRIMLGTYALSAGYYDEFYAKAQKVRTLIRRDFETALEGRHAIALPTSPTPPFRIGERIDDPLQMYLSDVFTVGPALAGLPSISVPTDVSVVTHPDLKADGRLPAGIQFTGRAWEDATLYRIARALEPVSR
jgi:aspartyl-tRNA(Asn)/glutamyl-tRNA(Gln) amidotransferase subunit A